MRGNLLHQAYQPLRVLNPVGADHIQPHSHLICRQNLLPGNLQLLKLQVEDFAAYLPAIVPEEIGTGRKRSLQPVVKVEQAHLPVLHHDFLVKFRGHQLPVHPGQGFLHRGGGDVDHLEFVLLKDVPEQGLRPGQHLPECLVHKPQGDGGIRQDRLDHPRGKCRVFQQNLLRDAAGIDLPGHGGLQYLVAQKGRICIAPRCQELLIFSIFHQVSAFLLFDDIRLKHIVPTFPIQIFQTEKSMPRSVLAPGALPGNPGFPPRSGNRFSFRRLTLSEYPASFPGCKLRSALQGAGRARTASAA